MLSRVIGRMQAHRSYWSQAKRALATYHAAAIMLFATSPVEPSALEKTIHAERPATAYVSHASEPYITLLAGTQVEYKPAEEMQNLWGYTYPGSRVDTINDGLPVYLRTGTLCHENMHNIIHLVGANKGLSRVQEEDLARRAARAQLGPRAAWMHPIKPISE